MYLNPNFFPEYQYSECEHASFSMQSLKGSGHINLFITETYEDSTVPKITYFPVEYEDY